MPSRLLDLVDQAYTALLSAYPAAFRERFAAEMAQVFRSLCRQTYIESGRGAVLAVWLSATWDGLLAVLHQWILYLRKQRMGIMRANLIDRQDGIQPLSALQTAVAVLPFILFGITSMVSKSWTIPGPPSLIYLRIGLVRQPYVLFNGFILIGLAIGLLAGFPRWTYTYLGWEILFIWWWSGIYIYRYPVGTYAWIPILGVFVLALLVRRSWQPLRTMLAGLWLDWTLLSLGIYILYSFAFMLFDENHHPYLFAFMGSTTLAVSLGAWLYFRSLSPLRRVLSLAGGSLLAGLLSGISEATWDYATYYGLPEGSGGFNLVRLIFVTVLALLMLGNGLLACWRNSRLTRWKGS